jgi:hypothetical protein
MSFDANIPLRWQSILRKVTEADSFEKFKLLVAVASLELGPQVYSETITEIYASTTRVLLRRVDGVSFLSHSLISCI